MRGWSNLIASTKPGCCRGVERPCSVPFCKPEGGAAPRALHTTRPHPRGRLLQQGRSPSRRGPVSALSSCPRASEPVNGLISRWRKFGTTPAGAACATDRLLSGTGTAAAARRLLLQRWPVPAHHHGVDLPPAAPAAPETQLPQRHAAMATGETPQRLSPVLVTHRFAIEGKHGGIGRTERPWSTCQAAAPSTISAIPAATLRPAIPSTLSGCSAIDL